MRVGKMEVIREKGNRGALNTFAEDIRRGICLEIYKATDEHNTTDYFVEAVEVCNGLEYWWYSPTTEEYGTDTCKLDEFYNIENVAYRCA